MSSDTQVASLATSTKVLSTVANSKAAAKSATYDELWSSVGDSVINHSVHFNKLKANEC